jgi:bifunctional non-homologous end joining protein LigD
VAGVAITHADRLVYPDAGISKLAVARYYETVGARMLPQIAGRPLTLVFCPEGVAAGCAYLRHGPRWTPRALRRVGIREKTKVGEYMVVESIEGLVSLAQMNWIEAHTWNSTIDHLELPDRVVFDLDPGPAISWVEVVDAARRVREVLQALELESWVKTTGGRGLHVVVPFQPAWGWDRCFSFAKLVAGVVSLDRPDRYTLKLSKAGRERKILIDYLRNNRGNTSIAAFSPRAKPGATVSMPLDWSELSARNTPDRFTIETVPKRLRSGSDPWQAYWRARQQLTEEMMAALARLSR